MMWRQRDKRRLMVIQAQAVSLLTYLPAREREVGEIAFSEAQEALGLYRDKTRRALHLRRAEIALEVGYELVAGTVF